MATETMYVCYWHPDGQAVFELGTNKPCPDVDPMTVESGGVCPDCWERVRKFEVLRHGKSNRKKSLHGDCGAGGT